LLGWVGNRLFWLLGFFVVLVCWDSVFVFRGSVEVTMVDPSGARGYGTLVKIAGESVIFLEFKMKKMRVFGSTDKIWMLVFPSESFIVLSWL
jgi:hypothetical protein